jgi:uncharacterized membrane protein YgcG
MKSTIIGTRPGTYPSEKIMNHIFLIIFMFLMICGSPETDLAAASPPWPPAVLANTDKMVEKGLPREEIMTVTGAMLQARFAEQHIVSLQTAVMQAHNQGLPTGPLNDKILEGIAKHAAAPSIIMAMERVTNRYAHAFELASQLTGERGRISQWGTLIATGNAAGLNFVDMESILQKVRTRTDAYKKADFNNLTMETLTTARDMARQSVSSTSVTEIVTLAIDKGFNARDMRQLNTIFSNQALGTPLATLTANCIAGLQKGLSPSETLQKLNSGTRFNDPDTTGRKGMHTGSSEENANNSAKGDSGSGGGDGSGGSGSGNDSVSGSGNDSGSGSGSGDSGGSGGSGGGGSGNSGSDNGGGGSGNGGGGNDNGR